MERPRYKDKKTGTKRLGMVEITHEWAEEMGGRIEVTTKPGHWLVWAGSEMGCFIRLVVSGPDMPLCDEGAIPTTVKPQEALTWKNRCD